jgi:nucleotide-binding universal stress UspA family protein
MKLVVGVADDATSVDAVAYGATLAKTFDAHVTVVTVSATADEYINDHLDPRMGTGRSDEQVRLVDSLADVLESKYGIRAQTVVHHHRSLGTGLSEIAAELDADMVVVGSGPGGSIGRFSMGSTTNALLHRSAVPLVLVPNGYVRHPVPTVGRVLVAFAQGAEGEAALARGAALARAAGVPLRVLTILVRHRVYGSDLGADAEGGVLTASLEMLRQHQAHALSLTDTEGIDISNDVLVGDSPLSAMGREDWDTGDLLVVASGTGGLLKRVFLGDTNYKILRASTVPTLVLPRHHD